MLTLMLNQITHSMKSKFTLLFYFLFFSVFSSFAQESITADTSKYNQEIDPSEFDDELFTKMLFDKINEHRIKFELDSIVEEEILTQAAQDNGKYMASVNKEVDIQKGKKKTTGDRIMFYGGSKFGYELTRKVTIKKGKIYLTYRQAIDEIMFKWTSGKKKLEILDDKNLIFVGIGAFIDGSEKRLYVSAVFGNYKSFNKGADKRKELAVPYTKKKYGLKGFDFTVCKKCKKYKNIGELQAGLFVRDGKIWFKTNNVKKFKKLIKGGKDGIAVDIVQRAQYSCDDDNIIDNNLNNKGILLKRYYKNKLFKKNIYRKDTKARRQKLEVAIGKWPKKLDPNSEYELNLVIIKDKHVCYNIPQSYSDNGSLEFSQNGGLIADTVMIEGFDEYIPKPEITELNFKIPFEKNKSTYKQEDIQPFVDALNEPEFIIKDLKVKAYSSIEGNVAANIKLQKRRAESIISTLKEMQNNKNIKAEITTDDSWEDFKHDVQGTEYEFLAEKTKEEAQKYIRENKLSDKLEPILKNERYAEMSMTVTYDIMGKKQEPYVVSRFNRAAKSCDKDKALLIQKYIFKQVLDENYSKKAIYNQVIDSTNADCAGLLMNKLWLEQWASDEDLNSNICKRIDALNNLAPTNNYILYNKYICDIDVWNSDNASDIFMFQKKINDLYKSPLPKETVDNLNLEFQFKIIGKYDTLDKPIDIVVRSLERIKEIVNVDGSSWKDALKLSYLFMEHKDYDFAAKLLEPFIYNKFVFDELIFTYISLCSHSSYRMMSNRFYTAMLKAKELDKTRFCKLFAGDKLSIQVLENTQVKKLYCKNCDK